MRAAFAGVLIGLVVGGAALAPPIHAQPAPDLARAKDLYLSAEKAMADGRYADAIRDYGATFEITRDPILFYKIASAHEKAGKCDVALIYYGRYIKEARPTDRYVELTKERVRACGGDDRSTVANRPPDPGPGSATGSADAISSAGSADAGSAAAPVDPGPGSAAGSAVAVGSGSAVAPAPVVGRHRGAWLLVATGIGLVTVGSILAYSANSAESDITDLYEGFTGTPAAFDAKTRATYDNLVAEGRRYEKLSWLSFGLAGVTAVGAIVLFKTGATERRVTVAPTATATSGGVRATLTW
jgi:tetratricopeptide (TPR) repeat protein